MIMIEKVRESDFTELAELADGIWHEFFPPIIGEAQTDYMVEHFQSYDAIVRQTSGENYFYYFIKSSGGELAGYFAIAPNFPENGKLFLSKLYLKKSFRGQHLASEVFCFLEKLPFRKIHLTVNRYNDGAVSLYRRRGFTVTETVDKDIGGGFFMNDYIMELDI
ncbi:N-acetyltransferase [Clostridia bacterium]|nr:N-acetyltransferase [Clostridia bacterium]